MLLCVSIDVPLKTMVFYLVTCRVALFLFFLQTISCWLFIFKQKIYYREFFPVHLREYVIINDLTLHQSLDQYS